MNANGVLRVVLVGSSGRMGGFARELLAGEPDLSVVRELRRGDDVQMELRAAGADVGLDFTVAGRGAEHALWMVQAGLHAVVGTSGVTPDELAELDAAARGVDRAVLVVANFSLGALFCRRAVRELARHFPSAGIVERHHPEKRDAPSATALALARAIREGRRGGPAATDDVPIQSVRGAEFYAHHEVRLAGPGESLTLSHDMSTPEAFGPGLVRALRGVSALPPGVHTGLEAVWEP